MYTLTDTVNLQLVVRPPLQIHILRSLTRRECGNRLWFAKMVRNVIGSAALQGFLTFRDGWQWRSQRLVELHMIFKHYGSEQLDLVRQSVDSDQKDAPRN